MLLLLLLLLALLIGAMAGRLHVDGDVFGLGLIPECPHQSRPITRYGYAKSGRRILSVSQSCGDMTSFTVLVLSFSLGLDAVLWGRCCAVLCCAVLKRGGSGEWGVVLCFVGLKRGGSGDVVEE